MEWEYKYISRSTNMGGGLLPKEDLNYEGKFGWELVSVVSTYGHEGMPNYNCYCFKRKIKEKDGQERI